MSKYKVHFNATKKRVQIILLRRIITCAALKQDINIQCYLRRLRSKPIRPREILRRTRDDKVLSRDNDIQARSLLLSAQRKASYIVILIEYNKQTARHNAICTQSTQHSFKCYARRITKTLLSDMALSVILSGPLALRYLYFMNFFFADT